jgi:hypothetical protein
MTDSARRRLWARRHQPVQFTGFNGIGFVCFTITWCWGLALTNQIHKWAHQVKPARCGTPAAHQRSATQCQPVQIWHGSRAVAVWMWERCSLHSSHWLSGWGVGAWMIGGCAFSSRCGSCCPSITTTCTIVGWCRTLPTHTYTNAAAVRVPSAPSACMSVPSQAYQRHLTTSA